MKKVIIKSDIIEGVGDSATYMPVSGYVYVKGTIAYDNSSDPVLDFSFMTVTRTGYGSKDFNFNATKNSTVFFYLPVGYLNQKDEIMIYAQTGSFIAFEIYTEEED